MHFSKKSKTNFPKQFVTDLSFVLKKYFILSVSLHNRISSVIILQNFGEEVNTDLYI